MTRYFEEINQGIEALLADDENQIQLSPEMLPFERKLNTVKRTLAERKAETALAEQRKDELVMYLAHDIRTPLTSVIGYLNLLEEEPNIPEEQRAKRVHIALEKAYRLETMINEFFEITRYNSQQITLSKETIDLYYMLVQLSDELSPVFAPRKYRRASFGRESDGGGRPGKAGAGIQQHSEKCGVVQLPTYRDHDLRRKVRT